MTFSTPRLRLGEVLEVAGRYGYDGIELRLDSGHAHGVEVEAAPAQRAAIKRQASEAGIALACLATSLKFANATAVDETLRQAHERIDLAGDVGAPAMRIFGGQLAKGFSREQAIGLMVRSLRSVADHAAERGVALCLETHDDWCDPAHVAAVLERVAHRAVGANWDILHPQRVCNVGIDEAFQTLKPWIRHTHVHDGDAGKKMRYLPIGQGVIDHRRALELLMGMSFDGYLSGEWLQWEAYEIHLPRELATLKRYERELA